MNKPPINLSPVRSQFPALQETDAHGRPYVYFDGPGGTQIPQRVIDAMDDYLVRANANQGGHFITSHRNDDIIDRARAAMADFFNAASASEIVFGANMTSLTFSFSRAIGRMLQPGDEIIVTHLDHDGNIAPWAALEENGIVVKWADFRPADCRLDLDHLATLLNEKTKLVALGYASNAVGTINPVAELAEMVHAVGAWLWVDAVHYAPHGPIDVQRDGCDFMVCSAYKFFGPHVGVLWGRPEILEQLAPYKVRPSKNTPPHKFETGTLNHEGLAGISAAIDYLAEVGRKYGNRPDAIATDAQSRYSERRLELKQAMEAIMAYERPLFGDLLGGIEKISGIRIYGITNPMEFDQRCPTLAFTREGRRPSQIAEHLGNQGIFVWDGNYYALAVTERLGVEDSGGMVRVGLAHYNTREEIDRLIAVLQNM